MDKNGATRTILSILLLAGYIQCSVCHMTYTFDRQVFSGELPQMDLFRG